MIRAFLFDNGGVMTDGGRGTELTDRLGEVLGVTGDEAYTYLGPVWTQYSCGAITEPALWAYIEQASGQSVPLAKRAIWNTWKDMHLYPEMVALVQELRNAGYPVGLLSNVIPNTAREIRTHGGYELFDFAVLSCEVGVAKPDPKIYELALAKLPGIMPSQVAFIDDQERCLVPARALAMHTILAQMPSQVIAEVHALLQLTSVGFRDQSML